MTSSDRRRFRRVPISTEIRADVGGRPYEVRAENISAGGMLVRTDKTLPDGQVVHLTFTLPGTTEPIHIKGTVQHVSPNAFMGIRFEDLSPAVEKALQKFVESNEPVA